MRDNGKISILRDAKVEEVLGEHSVKGIVVRDTRTHARRFLEVEGLFVAIGSDPHPGPFEGLPPYSSH